MSNSKENDISSGAPKFENIDKVLLGVIPSQSIGIDCSEVINFSEEKRSNKSAWKLIQKFIKESNNKSFNDYFIINNMRNKIHHAIEKVVDHHDLLFKNFNTFKAYLLQKFVLPFLQNRNSKISENKEIGKKYFFRFLLF